MAAHRRCVAWQVPLWLARDGRLVPLIVRARWVCIGCRRAEVPKKQTYCPRCIRLLRRGLPLDLGDVVTKAESRLLSRRMPGQFNSFRGRPGK